MIDIKQKIEDMNRAKRNDGSNRTIERNTYFSKYKGQFRKVVLKTTSNVKENFSAGSAHFEVDKMKVMDSPYANRLLNDFPEYIEAVAATMMETEDGQYLGTYYVVKEKFISRVTGKPSWKYVPVLENNMPKLFNMEDVGLKSYSELQEELEATKVEEEYAKLKKELGFKLQAKAKLEKEFGTKIDDKVIEEIEIKAKAKGKVKK